MYGIYMPARRFFTVCEKSGWFSSYKMILHFSMYELTLQQLFKQIIVHIK